jgi:hypothetical protein
VLGGRPAPLSDLIDACGGDVPSALAQIRGQRAARPAAPRAARPGPSAQTAAEQAPSSDDTDVAREMERILGTPVKLTRTEREVRVTITFYTEEHLQDFFDTLNSPRSQSKASD